MKYYIPVNGIGLECTEYMHLMFDSVTYCTSGKYFLRGYARTGMNRCYGILYKEDLYKGYATLHRFSTYKKAKAKFDKLVTDEILYSSK